MRSWLYKNYLWVVFGISLLSTLGSLYFSEVLAYLPCLLCWYQRVFMYPIAVISAVALIKDKEDVGHYINALSAIGGLIALYHTYIYYTQDQTSYLCTAGISCTTKYIEWLGFISIPLLSFLAFLIIFIAGLLKKKTI